MQPIPRHLHVPDASFDGGDLDCGNGLLLLIRKHIDPIEKGQLLEVRSTEISVDEELPAWCRLTGNELMSWTKHEQRRSFLICKGEFANRVSTSSPSGRAALDPMSRSQTMQKQSSRSFVAIPELAITGVGSWPRPSWMVRAIEDHLRGRMPDNEFEACGDDAVRLAVHAQMRAKVDLLTDGEQRRDSYSSFVGERLANCQMIPLTDLLPLVDDSEKFEKELRALDVPASEVRHPAVFGRVERARPLALHEAQFLATQTTGPIKVALPGPYLLTRTLWLECFRERAYATREDLSQDVVKVLREELADLLAFGVSLVQFDEPVLSEVVFSGPAQQRTFMCGALSEKKDAASELRFAQELVNAVVQGFPTERTALHVCRGNWTRDESVLLNGDYRPLQETLAALQVGTLFLEFSTPRAGELTALKELPERFRIGVGVVNPRSPEVESAETLDRRMAEALRLFGRHRVLFNPDCGFATFAANPVASAEIAEAKLNAMVAARDRIRDTGT